MKFLIMGVGYVGSALLNSLQSTENEVFATTKELVLLTQCRVFVFFRDIKLPTIQIDRAALQN